jgi:hypothetical protein
VRPASGVVGWQRTVQEALWASLRALRGASDHLGGGWGEMSGATGAWKVNPGNPLHDQRRTPLSPSTHLPLERGLDRQVILTDVARYGASTPTRSRQGAKYGALVV